MKYTFWSIMMLAGAFALSMRASEVDDLKTGLIGHTMGGREKSWKFQSTQQIKELTIKESRGDSQKRVFTIALQLQATPSSGKYAAEARVDCAKAGTKWDVKQVGLLSLKKIE
jgi:hypothetical protein